MRLIAFTVWLLLLVGPGFAQVVPVSAGEHADFTRLVLRIPQGTAWRLSADGRIRTLDLSADSARFDLERLFTRIPRTRLASATAEGNRLRLTLACDCDLRAWEDRPGLVILDIRDAPTLAAEPTRAASPPVRALARPLAPQPIDPIETARAAGGTVARALAAIAPPPAPSQPESEPPMERLAVDLGFSLSRALGQGLLDPAPDHAAPPLLLTPDATPSPDLPANMRIETVLDRPDPEAPPPSGQQGANCQGADTLDALLDRPSDDFSRTYGTLSQGLYAEFDQPDPAKRHDLILLYLASGFGAEARVLIENAQDPIAGRDLALGVADVLEDRASNSRMRLAQSVDCGGVAAVMALLAGAPLGARPDLATEISLTFTRLPAAFRAMAGARLVDLLAQAGDLDPARVVADSTRRSPWISRSDAARLDAALDRARGHGSDALLRLEHDNSADPQDVQARLDLSLETHTDVPASYLADASALAAAERNTATGPELMASILRVQARSGMSDDAFVTLDRLERWMIDTGENRRLLDQLRDDVWRNLAERGSDLDIVQSVLAREDWRDSALTAATRLTLSRRLLELGLETPVSELIGNDTSEDARRLLAQAALAQGNPRLALDRIGQQSDADSRQIRAAALARAGDAAGAAAEFAALGITDQAIRAAIVAGDWSLVNRLSQDQGAETAVPDDLGQILEHAPGHAEIAREIRDQGDLGGDRAGASSGVTPQDPSVNTGPSGTAPPPRPATGGGTGGQDQPASPATGPGADTPRPQTGVETGQNRHQGPQEPPTTPGAADTENAPRMAGATDLPTPASPAVPGRAASVNAADIAQQFDRLGLVSRSSTLLAESERLRDALAPLLAPSPGP